MVPKGIHKSVLNKESYTDVYLTHGSPSVCVCVCVPLVCLYIYVCIYISTHLTISEFICASIYLYLSLCLYIVTESEEHPTFSTHFEAAREIRNPTAVHIEQLEEISGSLHTSDGLPVHTDPVSD